MFLGFKFPDERCDSLEAFIEKHKEDSGEEVLELCRVVRRGGGVLMLFQRTIFALFTPQPTTSR